MTNLGPLGPIAEFDGFSIEERNGGTIAVGAVRPGSHPRLVYNKNGKLEEDYKIPFTRDALARRISSLKQHGYDASMCETGLNMLHLAIARRPTLG